MVDKVVTQRLKLYVLMKNDGYLSMSGMMSLISDVAQNSYMNEQQVIKELNRLYKIVDFESSDLYFYFEEKK